MNRTRIFKWPRFSLKWLMVFVTALSVLLYALIIHPTVRANQFVNAIKNGDFSTLEVMRPNGGNITMLEDLQSWHKSFTFENCKVSAEINPRTWRDVYKCRRKIDRN